MYFHISPVYRLFYLFYGAVHVLTSTVQLCCWYLCRYFIINLLLKRSKYVYNWCVCCGSFPFGFLSNYSNLELILRDLLWINVSVSLSFCVNLKCTRKLSVFIKFGTFCIMKFNMQIVLCTSLPNVHPFNKIDVNHLYIQDIISRLLILSSIIFWFAKRFSILLWFTDGNYVQYKLLFNLFCETYTSFHDWNICILTLN